MGWTYCSNSDLAGADINGLSTSDFSKLKPFLFIFHLFLFFFFFKVKCPFEVSKVQVKLYLWTWGARETVGLFATYRRPNCAFVSFLSPCVQGIFMHIILFYLHNNPLIYSSFGITDPIWPITTGRLRGVVTQCRLHNYWVWKALEPKSSHVKSIQPAH